MTWQEYFKNTKNYKPRELLVQAADFVSDKEIALDIGSGALNESSYLLSQGFKKVIAVDKEPIAQTVADMLPLDRFEYVITSAEKFNFGCEVYSLVNAQYVLPFLTPHFFSDVMEKIFYSLKSGGIFTGQFFGLNDEWNIDKSGMTFLSRSEIDTVLSKYSLLVLSEEEKDKETATGSIKHWHVFHFIVKKD
jgi:tellurite methyltransferase